MVSGARPDGQSPIRVNVSDVYTKGTAASAVPVATVRNWALRARPQIHQKERVVTASVDNRLERRFELWDSNGDGVIDRGDYETEARRVLQAFGEHETSPKGRTLMHAYLYLWDRLAELAHVHPGEGISKDQFLAAAAAEIGQRGDVGFDRSLRPTIEAIVDLVDTDGDGEVSPPEFKRWLAAVGIDERQADIAFAGIDTDGSGALSVEELVASVRDYHQGKHDIPLLGG
jgi:Ca2+-binding EF-hand superfamily protein